MKSYIMDIFERYANETNIEAGRAFGLGALVFFGTLDCRDLGFRALGLS